MEQIWVGKSHKTIERTKPVNMIVIHGMGEFLKTDEGDVHASDFLKDIGLSAHALIEPNGNVLRMADTNEVCYHAKGYNAQSIGIELLLEGTYDYGSFIESIENGEDLYNANQLASAYEFCRRAIQWHPDITIENIVSHREIDYPRKKDPAKNFDMDHFREVIRKTIKT